MKSKWLKHVKSVQNAHPSWSLKEVLEHASKTYKKK
jgi:hypothetical protein